MKDRILFLLFNFLLFVNSTIIDDLPVIAILSNPEPLNSDNALESQIDYQMIRWLDQSLAKMVVIHPWFSNAEIDNTLSNVDAVIFLGGDRDLRIGGQFENVAKYILEKIIYFKDVEKKNLTLWGTCQGMELLHVLIANTTDALGKFDAESLESSLILNKVVLNDSRLFTYFQQQDLQVLEKVNTLAEFHSLGTGFDEYKKYPQLASFFRITSLGKDRNGVPYFNSVEAKDYPIYAVQFHPEMISYTNVDRKGVPDNKDAVRISQIFSNFIVEEARNNKQNNKRTHKYDKKDFIDTFNNIPVNDGTDWYYFKFAKKKSTSFLA